VDAADDAWAAALDPPSPHILLAGYLDHTVSGAEGETAAEQETPSVSHPASPENN
jgi:hypothetical protein